VVMPGMSGPELARTLRAIRPDMARLFVSGYAGEVISRHRLDGEGDLTSVLEKPFRADELLEAVAGAVTQSHSV
jgi:two-component system cell cycle sensor histidine kinase/response regulator CckA